MLHYYCPHSTCLWKINWILNKRRPRITAATENLISAAALIRVNSVHEKEYCHILYITWKVSLIFWQRSTWNDQVTDIQVHNTSTTLVITWKRIVTNCASRDGCIQTVKLKLNNDSAVWIIWATLGHVVEVKVLSPYPVWISPTEESQMPKHHFVQCRHYHTRTQLQATWQVIDPRNIKKNYYEKQSMINYHDKVRSLHGWYCLWPDPGCFCVMVMANGVFRCGFIENIPQNTNLQLFFFCNSPHSLQAQSLQSWQHNPHWSGYFLQPDHDEYTDEQLKYLELWALAILFIHFFLPAYGRYNLYTFQFQALWPNSKSKAALVAMQIPFGVYVSWDSNQMNIGPWNYIRTEIAYAVCLCLYGDADRVRYLFAAQVRHSLWNVMCIRNRVFKS